jgi:hypothetical protein
VEAHRGRAVDVDVVQLAAQCAHASLQQEPVVRVVSVPLRREGREREGKGLGEEGRKGKDRKVIERTLRGGGRGREEETGEKEGRERAQERERERERKRER